MKNLGIEIPISIEVEEEIVLLFENIKNINILGGRMPTRNRFLRERTC